MSRCCLRGRSHLREVRTRSETPVSYLFSFMICRLTCFAVWANTNYPRRVQARTEQQCHHLVRCWGQPQEIVDIAHGWLMKENHGRMGGQDVHLIRHVSVVGSSIVAEALLDSAMDTSPSFHLNTLPTSANSSPFHERHHHLPQISTSGPSTASYANTPDNPSPLSTNFTSFAPDSPFRTPPPAISRSVSYESISQPRNPPKRQRTEASAEPHSSDYFSRSTVPPGIRQQRFESRITRLTASAGFPLQWVDDPEWLQFLSEFLPDLKPFNRKKLTNKLLPEEVFQNRQLTMAHVKELPDHQRVCTLQTDGWTGVNRHHLLAFMITTFSREVCYSVFSCSAADTQPQTHMVEVKDVSDTPTTGEQLLSYLENVILVLLYSWTLAVVCVTADASGESRKARKLLVNKRPDLVAPDCQSHQVPILQCTLPSLKSNFHLQDQPCCRRISER